MYLEGKSKLQKLNESAATSKLNLSYYNEELTLKPKINKKSEKIVAKKSPDRSVVESLYSDARRRIREASEHSQDKENQSFDSTHISLVSQKKTTRLMVEKIEKELQMGLIHLEADEAIGRE